MTSPRTVLITGASSGIALELARCFALDGDALVLTDRDSVALAAIAEELRRAHSGTVTTADLQIDALINNAGFGVHGNFTKLDTGEELALTTVHLLAPWRLTKAFLLGTMLSRFRTRTGRRDRASWFTQTSARVAEAGYRGFQRTRAVIVPGIASKFYVLGTWVFPISWLGRYVYLTAYRIHGMSAPRLSKGEKL